VRPASATTSTSPSGATRSGRSRHAARRPGPCPRPAASPRFGVQPAVAVRGRRFAAPAGRCRHLQHQRRQHAAAAGGDGPRDDRYRERGTPGGDLRERCAVTANDATITTVNLTVSKYGYLTLVPTELVQDATFDLEGYISQAAGRELSRTIAYIGAAARSPGSPPPGSPARPARRPCRWATRPPPVRAPT
jgi:hypothetical protein